MDDSEVEMLRALLAMDGVLKWRPWVKKEIDDQLGDAYKQQMKGLVESAPVMQDGKLALYRVRAKTRHLFRRVYTAEYVLPVPRTEEFAPHDYQTVADAKAACERHYASLMQGGHEGKWD